MSWSDRRRASAGRLGTRLGHPAGLLQITADYDEATREVSVSVALHLVLVRAPKVEVLAVVDGRLVNSERARMAIAFEDLPAGIAPKVGDRLVLGVVPEGLAPEEMALQGSEILRVSDDHAGAWMLEVAR